MTIKEKRNADNFAPRLLGFMFVFVAIASLAGGFLIGSLNYTLVGPPDNISETMTKMSDNATTMQLSIAVYLMEAAAIVLLTVLLYTTLKTQSKIAARWAFGLWLVEAVAVVLRQIGAFSLLFTSLAYANAGAPDASYFHTLGSLFYESTQFIYSAQMVFYCIGGILFYYLFLKSDYVPRVLALWGIMAASLGLIGTLLELFDLNVPMVVFLPILPFELAIGIWLMVKGFNTSEIAPESV